MKLTRIVLRNFQRHKLLDLKLSKHITTIIGPTDAGKSAVIRALRWVCLNDQPGVGYIREGAKEAQVELHLLSEEDQVFRVVRTRSERHNTYSLNDKEYKAFGTDVPPDVARILALTAIHFQSQHDLPFWLSESPPEVARQLNQVVDLSSIDRALEAASQTHRKLRDRQVLVSEMLEEQKTAWEGHKTTSLPRIQAFEHLDLLHQAHTDTETNCNRLEGLVKEMLVYRDSPYQAQAEAGEALLSIADAANACSRSGMKLDGILRKAKGLDTTMPPSLEELDSIRKQLGLMRGRIAALVELTEEADTARFNLQKAETRAKGCEAEIHKRFKGKVCPLCQNRI